MIVDWNFAKLLIEKVINVNEKEEVCNCVIRSTMFNIVSFFH